MPRDAGSSPSRPPFGCRPVSVASAVDVVTRHSPASNDMAPINNPSPIWRQSIHESQPPWHRDRARRFGCNGMARSLQFRQPVRAPFTASSGPFQRKMPHRPRPEVSLGRLEGAWRLAVGLPALLALDAAGGMPISSHVANASASTAMRRRGKRLVRTPSLDSASNSQLVLQAALALSLALSGAVWSGVVQSTGHGLFTAGPCRSRVFHRHVSPFPKGEHPSLIR